MITNFRAGIVSVTFRQYAFRHFIEYVKLTDLSCIEWGSDIHVPYNDSEKAEAVGREMKENNLAAASYGSYYRLGQPHPPELFPMLIVAAKKISSPMIRVWGGTRASRYLDEKSRKEIIDDTLDISKQAKRNDITISVEYHPQTITDTAESALEFIKEIRYRGGSNVYLYWQANQHISFQDNLYALVQICPYLSNVHVFAWEKSVRLPLSEHSNRWENYISVIKAEGGSHDFLLEFVKGDSVGQMTEDAKVLIDLLNK